MFTACELMPLECLTFQKRSHDSSRFRPQFLNIGVLADAAEWEVGGKAEILSDVTVRAF